jgi:uncharacterized repeat protein (TIGR01451 family)
MKAMRLTMYKSTRVTGMALALATLLNTTAPVWATVDNTVTVSGTAPDSSTVTATGSATVDVQNAAPQISLNKTHAFAPGGDLNNNGLVDPGDVILFTYTATNTGNVTLANVVASDTAFQGTGTAPTISPASVASLAPGGTTSFTSTYTVVAGDLVISGNVDSDLDSTGQVVGNYNPGTGNTTVADRRQDRHTEHQCASGHSGHLHLHGDKFRHSADHQCDLERQRNRRLWS